MLNNNLLDKFIQIHLNDNGLIGILLCGSRSLGNYTSKSDVDLRVIYDDKVLIDEKRTIIIDNILFSYSLKSSNGWMETIKLQFKNRSKFEARNFANSKIIYSNDIYRLNLIINWAEKILSQKFSPINEKQKNILKYSLWSHYTKIMNLPHDSLLFPYNYYILIRNILHIYTHFHGIENILEDKLEAYLNSEEFRKLYKISDLPDRIFKNLLLSAMEKVDKSRISKLYQYVQNKIGEININNLIIKH